MHSSAPTLILLFPVPYFLNSPGPSSFISSSSLVLFAAPPGLLSSADLISVVDDPFLLDLGPWGGASGRASSSRYVCRDAPWKSLFWLCRRDVFQTGLSPHIRGKKKCPGSQVFLGKKGAKWKPDCTNPQFKFLWLGDSTCRIQLLAVSSTCLSHARHRVKGLSLLLADLH